MIVAVIVGNSLIGLGGLAAAYGAGAQRERLVRLLAASSLGRAKRGCRHPRTVVVESIVTGEPLTRLCQTCDQQLSPLMSVGVKG